VSVKISERLQVVTQEHRYASFLVYFAEQLCRLQAEALKIKATRKN
jgi:hypothetical protein